MVGHAEELGRSLRQVINVAATETVPNARPRQANCYTSSDAVVADRTEFTERYAAVLSGEIDVEAGWRVYSNGPGIRLVRLVRLVRECALGLRVRAYGLEIDPVLTSRFDGVGVRVQIGQKSLLVRFRVRSGGGAVTRVEVAGTELAYRRLLNPYRTPGRQVSRATLDRLADGVKIWVIAG